MSKDDETAKATVLAVLADKNINVIKFTLGAFGVTPQMYADVAGAIKSKKITVLVEASFKTTKVQALYVNEIKFRGTMMYNLLLLRDPDLAGGVTDPKMKINTEFQAMMGIVHECTHAGFDMRKLQKMTTPYSEGAAYIAGAMFAVKTMRDTGGKPEKVSSDPTKLDAVGVAWHIARNLETARDKTVPRDSANALFVAIGKEPAYKDKMKDTVTLDGVDQKW